uniref:Uncharacterized protein n=1 Tax=Glossina austeni TaxID=7395 RepID=A0A1A9UIM0_GLOAU
MEFHKDAEGNQKSYMYRSGCCITLQQQSPYRLTTVYNGNSNKVVMCAKIKIYVAAVSTSLQSTPLFPYFRFVTRKHIHRNLNKLLVYLLAAGSVITAISTLIYGLSIKLVIKFFIGQNRAEWQRTLK